MHYVSPTLGKTQLTFIGGGVMACAILDGFAECPSSSVVSGPKAKYSVSITVRLSERIEDLSHRYPWAYVTDKNDDPKLWQFSKDNEPAAHIVLICTQPNATFQVCETIRLAHKHVAGARNLPTVVTMCPGITLSQIEGWLTSEDALRPATVIRTMPNTPVSIRQGATALVASRHATDGEVERVIEMLRIVSPCVETLAKEQLLDVAAAVSGSGPAYIFQFYKTLVAAGVQHGLPENLSRSLVLQTSVGASMLANNQPEIPLSSMIGNVCVPGGSTEKGIKSLIDAGIQKAVINAVGVSLDANHGMRGLK